MRVAESTVVGRLKKCDPRVQAQSPEPKAQGPKPGARSLEPTRATVLAIAGQYVIRKRHERIPFVRRGKRVELFLRDRRLLLCFVHGVLDRSGLVQYPANFPPAFRRHNVEDEIPTLIGQ